MSTYSTNNRKYPIGLQDFKKIRDANFLYIDKTEHIYKLIQSGKYYFLSRPRRFGKSLLLSTIKEIFNGHNRLFEGLAIYDKWDWKQVHPVIHLRLGGIDYQHLGLYEALNKEIGTLAKDLGLLLEASSLKKKFGELINKASNNGRIVILIDEYDKPITDYLEDTKKLEENCFILKNFYSALNDAGKHIRLLFITGVSNFTKEHVLSGQKSLQDITINRSYATLTGITQSELESNFATEIAEIQPLQPDLLNKLHMWYGGYAWHSHVDTVYNLCSILYYMDRRDFSNYWFHVGTPTWLIKYMKLNQQFELEDTYIDEIQPGHLSIKGSTTAAVLFQTGYLTIKGYDSITKRYTVGYPNKEVENSFNKALINPT